MLADPPSIPHILTAAAGALLLACAPSPAPRVELAVLSDGAGIVPLTNDRGLTVELTTCRAAIADLVLTTSGEFHDRSALISRLRRALLSDAWAHPGHAAGGEVIGELPGRFIVDWCGGDGVKLGDAELTVGDYNGADFTFIRAAEADGLPPGDPLIGHTLELAGAVTVDGLTFNFHALLDQDDGRALIGAPFELEVDAATTATLGLQLLTRLPDGATLFDGIELSADQPQLELLPGDDAYNRLVRATQSHDFYRVQPRP